MAHLKQNTYKELYRKECAGSPGIDAMMREVMHMLGDIDFEYEVALDKMERNLIDPATKKDIRRKIEAAHRARREPYVELLAQLRQRRHRLAFAG